MKTIICDNKYEGCTTTVAVVAGGWVVVGGLVCQRIPRGTQFLFIHDTTEEKRGQRVTTLLLLLVNGW